MLIVIDEEINLEDGISVDTDAEIDASSVCFSAEVDEKIDRLET